MNDIRALRESKFIPMLREYNLDEVVMADKGIFYVDIILVI